MMIIGGVEVEPNWQAKPEHPIREALSVVTGRRAKVPDYVQGYDFGNLTDDQHLALQDWASIRCEPNWATGYGTLDAALLIVKAAVENGNIPPADSKWRA